MISQALRFQILRRDGFRCYYCHRADVELQVDHVIPVALGGSDDPSNLVSACEPCNSGKAALPPDAPLVAAVDEDAARWSRAMQLAMTSRAQAREENQLHREMFLKAWNRWTYEWHGERVPLDLPGGWQTAVDELIQNGLTDDDIAELIDLTMGTQYVKDTFAYFRGCARNRISEIQAVARAFIDRGLA